jgi:hypothetical protein
MDATGFSETLIPIYQATRQDILRERNRYFREIYFWFRFWTHELWHHLVSLVVTGVSEYSLPLSLSENCYNLEYCARNIYNCESLKSHMTSRLHSVTYYINNLLLSSLTSTVHGDYGILGRDAVLFDRNVAWKHLFITFIPLQMRHVGQLQNWHIMW